MEIQTPIERLKNLINIICPMTQEDLDLLPQAVTSITIKKKTNLLSQGGAKKYVEIIRPDEEKFLNLQACSFLISTENSVI